MRRRYIVSGRVQGVGFRQFTAEAGRGLALSGWVRNLANGDVEAEAEGPEAKILEFEKALRQGPSLGRVDSVKVDELPAVGSLPSPFQITR
ncbi:MAG: acylphosphatase [Spirochaetes bacterium]|nr:acylphosphatase [Spirochaetota bacterium]